jgi:hypothetical protein
VCKNTARQRCAHVHVNNVNTEHVKMRVHNAQADQHQILSTCALQCASTHTWRKGLGLQKHTQRHMTDLTSLA